ncbi:renin receptor-like protein [Ditylenchus destructor]|nr:renin receptor-like protein [Ditylenchus destructor]
MSLSTVLLCSLLASLGSVAQSKLTEDDYKNIVKWRNDLGVYVFSSSDYPAMFGIIAGISIVLIVGIVFIVVGLLTMEPAKDSIIYRMTTTRMKKD